MKLAPLSLIGCALVFSAPTCQASGSFLDALKSFAGKVEEAAKQIPASANKATPANNTTPASAQNTPAQTAPGQSTDQSGASQGLMQDMGAGPPAIPSGTAADTAKIVASLPSFDVVGIKLGMPAKDAVGALEGMRPKLVIRPATIRYTILPEPLTYEVYAASPQIIRTGHLGDPDTEQIDLLLTMPPNREVVSRISRYVTFSKTTAPDQDRLAAALIRKYGPVSYDSHPANLYMAGVRTMLWVDRDGKRLQHLAFGQPEFIHIEQVMLDTPSFGETSFAGSFAGAGVDATRVRMDSLELKRRLQNGFEKTGLAADQTHFTMVYAEIMRACNIGISSPDVVGALLVTVGSLPLDRSATDATHQMLVAAAQTHQANEEKAAQSNLPSL